MSSKEQKIVTALREKFNPEAIILVGSQVTGLATTESDWDVFIFCGKWRLDEEVEVDGMKVDVNFAGWPAEDLYLDAGLGPIDPIEVLFDETHGKLTKLLENTKAAYEKGPLHIQTAECAFNLRSLNRAIGKLQKYQSEPEIQFYYKSNFYKLFIQAWFEQQNTWMIAPGRAIQTIQETDPETFQLLQKFVASSGKEVVEIVRKLSSSFG